MLLYGSETWRIIQKTLKRIQTFINKFLRRILHLTWSDKVSNTTLWERTKQLPVEKEIKKRKWRWIGHTLRKPATNITRQSLNGTHRGREEEGRETPGRDTKNERKKMGKKWPQTDKSGGPWSMAYVPIKQTDKSGGPWSMAYVPIKQTGQSKVSNLIMIQPIRNIIGCGCYGAEIMKVMEISWKYTHALVLS